MNKSQWIESARSFFRDAGKEEKRVKLLLLIGMLGMLLIFLSGFSPKRKTNDITVGCAVQGEDAEAFCRQTEEKILDLVDAIEGVGEAKVLVTLESGSENVYLREESKNTDTTRDYDGQNITSSREKDDYRSAYLLVEQNGTKTPLLQKQIEPVIRGVVVVCEGAGKACVAEQVVGAVTVALGIGSNRVYVAQMETPLS